MLVIKTPMSLRCPRLTPSPSTLSPRITVTHRARAPGYRWHYSSLPLFPTALKLSPRFPGTDRCLNTIVSCRLSYSMGFQR